VNTAGKDSITPADLIEIADCSPTRCHDALKWAAEEIAQLRRDLDIQKVNANAVLQAQLERDAAIEDVVRLAKALDDIGRIIKSAEAPRPAADVTPTTTCTHPPDARDLTTCRLCGQTI
jgi:hypothetical protein